MNRPLRRFLTATVAVTVLGIGTAWAGDAQKKNDVILHESTSHGPEYIEIFKKEGTNGKNYLYTVSQVRTSGGLFCTVITFASESAGTSTCLTSVPNPDAFIPLDPDAHPDVAPR